MMSAHWYAVGFASALDDGPIGVTVAGRPLVVARLGEGPDAPVVAFDDRCRHRGAALSPGHVAAAPDGTPCLVCPYHGLHHDAAGRAVHLPARPDDRLPSTLGLTAHPTEARHGFVWVLLDGGPQVLDRCAGEAPTIPDFSAVAEADRLSFELGPERWAVPAPLIVENFNDLGHFSTVHAATFADPSHPLVPAIAFAETAVGWDHHADMWQLDRVTLDGPLVPVQIRFSYRHTFPYASELIIDYDAERREWIQLVATPVDQHRSLVFQQNVRNFDLDGDVAAWHDFQWAVNEEDRIVLESLTPGDEIALSFDTFTIAYRRALGVRSHLTP